MTGLIVYLVAASVLCALSTFFNWRIRRKLRHLEYLEARMKQMDDERAKHALRPVYAHIASFE